MRANSTRWNPFLGLTVVFMAAMLAFPHAVAAEDFNWASLSTQNWLTSVQNQNPTGDCWAFSACGALEAKYMLTRDDNAFQPNLSEQHLVCETNPEMGGTGGGFEYKALDYFTSHGVTSETEQPFTYLDSSPYWPLDPGWESRVWKSLQRGFHRNKRARRQELFEDMWTARDLHEHPRRLVFRNGRHRQPCGGDYRIPRRRERRRRRILDHQEQLGRHLERQRLW